MNKTWYQSKTIWLAILQALSGILVALASELPELQGVGGFLIFKSCVDMWLRAITASRIE